MNGANENSFRRFMDAQYVRWPRNSQKLGYVLFLRGDEQMCRMRRQFGARRPGLNEKIGPFSGNRRQFNVKVDGRPFIAKKSRTKQRLRECLVIGQAQLDDLLSTKSGYVT